MITNKTKFTRQVKGGMPIGLSRQWVNLVGEALEALVGTRVFQPQTDGLAVQGAKEADVKISPEGMVITLQPQLNPQSFSGGGSAITWLHYKDDLGDCLKCVLWNGSSEGATVYVAKPMEIRTTITSETIAGSTYNYSYSLGTADTNGNHYITRTTSGAATETDGLTKPYVFDCELWAFTIPSITLNSQSCTLQDSNNASRYWGKQ